MPDEHTGRVGRLKALRSQAPDAPFADVLTECQPESHGSLVELACIDLIERLRLGSEARVEDYTRTIDGLNNADDILDLLDAEICVRRELGDSPTAKEMIHRYPNLRDRSRKAVRDRRHRTGNQHTQTFAKAPNAERTGF